MRGRPTKSLFPAATVVEIAALPPRNREALVRLGRGDDPEDVALSLGITRHSLYQLRLNSLARIARARLGIGGRRKREPPQVRGVAGGVTMKIAAIDLIPCSRCGLRGHLAGDPERCLNVATIAGSRCCSAMEME